MTPTHTRTAKSARRTVAMALLAVLAVVGSAFAVYAAKAKPDFKVSATPATRSIVAGDSATYTVAVKRSHGFKGAVTLAVTRLPGGASAVWKPPAARRCKRGAHCPRLRANVVGSSASAALLTIKTAAGTPVGLAKPMLTAKGGGRSHSAQLKLLVQGPAQLPGPGTPNAPGNPPGPAAGGGAQVGTFDLSASPSSASVIQSDQIDYALSINRGGGFAGPVGLGVSGLPADAGATFSPASTVNGGSATMTVATASTTPAGTYTLTITGSGSGTASRTTTVTLVVKPTQSFPITGSAGGPLSPGQSQPVDLSLTNPYPDVDLKITALGVSVADTTSDSGCSGSQNFQVVPMASGSFPLTLPAGQTRTLTELGVSNADQPHVSMLNLSTSQDACKGVSLSLHYTGSATK